MSPGSDSACSGTYTASTPRSAKRAVLDGRRQAAQDVRADEAEDARVPADLAHAVAVGERARRDLPRGRLLPGSRRGERERRAEAPAENARGDAERAHRERYQPGSRVRGVPRREGQQPSEVAHRARRDRDLHDVGARGRHPLVDRLEIVGRAVRVVPGQHQPASGLGLDDVVEAGAGLHVHEIEPALDGLGEQLPSRRRVAVREAAALGFRAAGEEQRLRAGPQERAEVELAREIRAHLEEVGQLRELRHAGDEGRGRVLREAHAELHRERLPRKRPSAGRLRLPRSTKASPGSLKRLERPTAASPGNPLMAADPRGAAATGASNGTRDATGTRLRRDRTEERSWRGESCCQWPSRRPTLEEPARAVKLETVTSAPLSAAGSSLDPDASRRQAAAPTGAAVERLR